VLCHRYRFDRRDLPTSSPRPFPIVGAIAAGIRPTTGGGIENRVMRPRMAANKFRLTASSASWKVTDVDCRVTTSFGAKPGRRVGDGSQAPAFVPDRGVRRDWLGHRDAAVAIRVAGQIHWTAGPTTPFGGPLAALPAAAKTRAVVDRTGRRLPPWLTHPVPRKAAAAAANRPNPGPFALRWHQSRPIPEIGPFPEFARREGGYRVS
jgi:hypothetical protein